MTQFRVYHRVIDLPYPVPGYLSCPRCGSTELHYPSSSVMRYPWPNGPLMTDNNRFPTYFSYYCLNCQNACETPTFIPDQSGLTPECQGTTNGNF